MVAAIGEQTLGPTDVSLSNWTVRPSSGCSVVLATHTAGAVSVDGYTLTLAANPWNIVRTYNLTPGQELLFACRYQLGTASNFVVYMSEADNVYDPLYGSFVGDQGAWSTAKMYFTVPPNGVAKLHFATHFQAPGLPNQTAGTVDVYGLQILDATLQAGNAAEAEEDTAASALLLKHDFLDGGADDVTLATLGKCCWSPRSPRSAIFQQPELRGLGQLHSGRLPAGGLRHDPEHRAHLRADAGETLLLRLPVQAGHGLQLGDVRQRGRQRLRGRHRHLPRTASGARRAGQRGPAELSHRNHGQHVDHQQHGQRQELHHGGRRVHRHANGIRRSNRGKLRSHRCARRHADHHRGGLTESLD